MSFQSGQFEPSKGVVGLPADAAVLSRPINWFEIGDTEHLVQFYEGDSFLIESVADFLTGGFAKGEGAIVVATENHLRGLEACLVHRGLDVASLIASGQFTCFCAEDVLSQLLRDDQISHEELLSQFQERLVAARAGGRKVRVFGEMVALLWAQGRTKAAMQLEELWSGLQETHSFPLFCAYPMSGFGKQSFFQPLSAVCAAHTRVLPAESYTTLNDSDERLRAVVLLQQQARALEGEVIEHRKTESRLQLVKEELETQVEDLRRLHEISLRLTCTLDMDSVLREVLTASLEVQNTKMGLLSMVTPTGDGLVVKHSVGFSEDFLRKIEFVPAGQGGCGAALQRKQRVVIEDVEVDPVTLPYVDAARKAGFRAVHCTPLITRAGTIIGVLSAHFAESKAPTEREVRLMDLYARMASDIIENAQLHHRVQQELERSEKALTRTEIARSEAESANRMKDEFLATVSHELRTPLNAIIGWSHMLRHGQLDQRNTERAFETIERNAKAQAQLVEDILDVSRIITGQLKLKIGVVDAAAVITAALDAVQLAADSKGIQLEVTLDRSARHILGDAARLQQVVWNLLSNAIKFTPTNGRVAVRLERREANVQIKVSDTGKGITREFLPSVFDRFRQADATSTREHGGLGLGLSIVRHFVELHGGTVEASSEGEDRGAMFTITLPSLGTNTAEVIPAPKPISLGQSRVRFAAVPMLTGKRVLLVDDDRDTLQVLEVMLGQHEAQIQLAASAAEALEVLQWYQPDVLVFDLEMPGEDGYSLIRRIRGNQTPNGNLAPAIALTAHVRVEERARALSAGFNLFVPKPVEGDELVVAILNLADAGLAV
jgi:signal transduction histidine kinase/ActR/RegA family two-component response regulator